MSTRDTEGVKVGDRVVITGPMPSEPDPLPVGTTGTVVRVLESSGQADVDWDAVNPVTGEPRKLLLLLDVDPYRVIPDTTCEGYGPEPTDTEEEQ
ncbi:hypothetical protein BST23_25310 [Mycolicibacterium elephantis]|uniref:DUF4314 domain-containing protein n=1 Tax=Mycolicibacterium elephantis TaxID=81858 RepID=A0A1X0CGS3_9MYCO|nr:hypothetical protein [Mycolicibacterium elephantis]ORA58700.1 hypothetical protein BST23_25310 [Mycolicibacterium elephantis]